MDREEFQSSGVESGSYVDAYARDCGALPAEGEQLCRLGAVLAGKGRYAEALQAFACALKNRPEDPLLKAYFALSLAASEHKLGEALKICELALERHFYRADLYLVLGRLYLLLGSRKKAFHMVLKGLEVEPGNRFLEEERERMNTRKRPLFPFLRRRHTLNVLAGKVRHRLSS